MLIEMKVSSLTVDPFTDMPIVILKDADGSQAVPIWIGLAEAAAIATELEKIQLDRPMAHDLMKSMVENLGARVLGVEVRDLRANTFYARIILALPEGRTIELDARPSDAIALALRASAPIRVAKKVVDMVRRIDVQRDMSDVEWTEDQEARIARTVTNSGPCQVGYTPDLLHRLGDVAFGKWKM